MHVRTTVEQPRADHLKLLFIPLKIGRRVWSSISNEHIGCVASPMVIAEWAVVSRKSERENRQRPEMHVDDEGC